MNPDLDVIKSSAEGLAAGLTHSLQTIVINLLGGVSTEVGAELQESARRWRERRALDLGRSVLHRLEGRPRRPIPRNVLVPAFDYATLEDREELTNMWVELLATAGNEAREEIDRVYVEILKDLTPLDARVLRWLRDQLPRAPEQDDPAKVGRPIGRPVVPLSVPERPVASREDVCRIFELTVPQFEQLASRLERLGLCDVGRYTFPTSWGASSTGSRDYDRIEFRPLGAAFIDAVSPRVSDSQPL